MFSALDSLISCIIGMACVYIGYRIGKGADKKNSVVDRATKALNDAKNAAVRSWRDCNKD